MVAILKPYTEAFRFVLLMMLNDLSVTCIGIMMEVISLVFLLKYESMYGE